MTPRPVAASVDDLVAGASSRVPMTSADSKSGARFERVVIDGEPYVLKHVDLRDDWIMRQTGDVGCVPVRVWETGVFDLLPPCIDHATVGAAREGGRGAVLMRDVGEWLVPSDATPIPPDQHLRLLDHLAALHAAAWGWRDTVGLVPVANRYSFFGPAAMACEAALGFPQPVPAIAVDGWHRLDTCFARAGRRAPAAARGAVAPRRRVGRDPEHAPARRHQVRQHRASGPTAARCSSTGRYRRGATARRARALPRPEPRPHSRG